MAAWGLVLLLLILAVMFVVQPWLAKKSEYEQIIDQSGDQLARMHRMIAARPAYEDQLTRIKQVHARSPHYLETTTPALAATKLQQAVKQAVESAGGKIASMQVTAPEQAGRLLRVPIKVRITGDSEVLLKTLHALESTEPLLLLDDVSINARVIRRRPRRRQPAADLPPPQVILTIQCEVVGFMRKGEA